MFDCLILDNFQFCSEFAQHTGGCKVHLFIDEFVINKETLRTFDAMNKKIDESCYVWLSIARATNETNERHFPRSNELHSAHREITPLTDDLTVDVWPFCWKLCRKIFFLLAKRRRKK